MESGRGKPLPYSVFRSAFLPVGAGLAPPVFVFMRLLLL